MRVLLDTCVLSEIRHPHGAGSVKNAVRTLDEDDLYLSVVTVGEIVKGIQRLDGGQRKQTLQKRIQGLEQFYSNCILNIDLEISHIWGELTAKAQKEGKVILVSDGLIASTAIRHGLHVMTRNVGDFKPTGAMVINPWDEV